MKLISAIAAFCIIALTSSADAQTVAGVWQQIDPDTGKVGALVTFAEKGSVYQGSFSKLFPDPGDDPNPRCHKCSGPKRDQPLIGLVFIDGMKRSGLDYEGGTILDPESGKLYHANMRLSRDGNSLTVRGYIGIPLFGQSQVWKRIP